MLRVFGTTDIDEIDRRNTETINYSEDELMPYVCGDYGEENSELAEDIIDFLYMAALPKVSDKHRKFMVDVFGTDSIEDIRQRDGKSNWNYVDEKIEPYLCGDDADLREMADDVEMFVHARYAVISAASGAIFGSAPRVSKGMRLCSDTSKQVRKP